jgi:uncharacterized protein YjbJ (UPF0337 family)
MRGQALPAVRHLVVATVTRGAEGKVIGMGSNKAKGKAKEAIGRVTHDRRLERQGRSEQKRADVKEKAPEVVDTVKEKARDAVDRTKGKIR